MKQGCKDKTTEYEKQVVQTVRRILKNGGMVIRKYTPGLCHLPVLVTNGKEEVKFVVNLLALDSFYNMITGQPVISK